MTVIGCHNWIRPPPWAPPVLPEIVLLVRVRVPVIEHAAAEPMAVLSETVLFLRVRVPSKFTPPPLPKKQLSVPQPLP